MRAHYLSFGALLLAYATHDAVTAQPRVPPQPAELPAEPDVREAIGPSDAALGLEVQARLYQALETVDLRVEVRDGVATLDGTVRTDSERLRAADIARDVTGVQRVLNELVVDTTPADDTRLDRDGATLETAVAAELRGDPVLASRDIQVIADRRSNTVTLTGEVGSQSEKERATRIAASAFTAGHVRNRLQVRTDR